MVYAQYLLYDKIVTMLQLQLVVTICPTSRDDRYSAIKKTCCVDHPIPSQVGSFLQSDDS